jgi:hypothetical protein
LDDIARGQNLFGGGPLSVIEMLLVFGMGDGSLYGHDLLGAPLPLLHLAQDFFLGADRLGRRELPPGLVFLSGHKLELAGGNARLEVGANLGIGVSLIPRRKASRKRSRSSVTASRSKLRSRAKVTASGRLSANFLLVRSADVLGARSAPPATT